VKTIVTVDLEHDLRSKETNSMRLALPKLLEFFDKHNIKATFFVVTSLLDEYETEIKAIAKKHEIASHSHTHTILTPENAEYEIKTSKERLEKAGIDCVGFRSPHFITVPNQMELLKKYGYQYDASLATWLPGRYRNLFLKKTPFTKEGLMAFPMPTFIYPFINAGLSYLKLLHPFSKLFPTTYMLYLHPWEFLEKKDLPKANSLIKRLLQRNTGKKAWNIFEQHLQKTGREFITCKNYYENMLRQPN